MHCKCTFKYSTRDLTQQLPRLVRTGRQNGEDLGGSDGEMEREENEDMEGKFWWRKLCRKGIYTSRSLLHQSNKF
jgi:hypothetical protein